MVDCVDVCACVSASVEKSGGDDDTKRKGGGVRSFERSGGGAWRRHAPLVGMTKPWSCWFEESAGDGRWGRVSERREKGRVLRGRDEWEGRCL